MMICCELVARSHQVQRAVAAGWAAPAASHTSPPVALTQLTHMHDAPLAALLRGRAPPGRAAPNTQRTLRASEWSTAPTKPPDWGVCSTKECSAAMSFLRSSVMPRSRSATACLAFTSSCGHGHVWAASGSDASQMDTGGGRPLQHSRRGPDCAQGHKEGTRLDLRETAVKKPKAPVVSQL